MRCDTVVPVADTVKPPCSQGRRLRLRHWERMKSRHGEESAFPGDTIWLVTYLFTTVLYGGNESLTYAQALMFSTMRVKTTATWET
jgi:hypothetical protein